MSSDPRPRWHAVGDGWVVFWRDEPGDYLDGTPEALAAIRSAFARERTGEILVTPTGPSVPATESEPLAVLAVLPTLPGVFFTSAGAPPVPDTPEGAVS